MILTAPPVTHPHAYIPLHSSPLSERSANVASAPRVSRYASAIMASSSSPSTKAQDAQKSVPFSKRSIKTAPMLKSQDAIKEKRRDLFFKKVAMNREDRRWEHRGDQILRLDFVKEQKRWEAEKARSAPTFEQWLEEDEELDFPEMSSQPIFSQSWQIPQQQSSQLPLPSSQVLPDATIEAESILELERQELEELAAMMEEDLDVQQHTSQSHFGSEDEDYDSLFMDYLSGQENKEPAAGNQLRDGHYTSLLDDGDTMDMS